MANTDLGYPALSMQLYRKMSDLLYRSTGITLKENKMYLMVHRLSKFVGPEKRYKSFEEYYDALLADRSGDMMVDFMNVLTTNWTFFFREELHFDFLRSYLRERAASEPYVRIWSAACSSGEEPYSMSIAALQSLDRSKQTDFKILATDISTKMLNFAKEGRYHYTKIRGHIEDKELKTYFDFDREKNDFVVRQNVRDPISFRYLNLLEPYPFNKEFDIVFLRNVLIYFDNKEKSVVVNKIAQYLKPGGFIITGLSESLVGTDHNLVMMKNSIYQKKR